MKAIIKKTWILGVLFFLVAGPFPPAYGQEVKMAYVDVARVFDDYQKTKDNDRVLQEAGRKKEEERDALVHEIRSLKDEVVLLNEAAKDKKQEELEGKVRELQTFDQEAKKALSGQRSEIVREIFKDIDDTVQRYGERRGLDLILNERALLYRTDRFDVTEDVLKELNKDYSKKRK